MSYRELRNFTEIMRALGYPRLISMESFRSPNFELVADTLYWMSKLFLYDSDLTIHEGIESEEDRVKFLSTISSALDSRAAIRLNTRKLYAADGLAVKELLKVASVLFRAMRATESSGESSVTFNVRLKDAKAAKSLAGDITEIGARLHNLLAREENESREARTKAAEFLDAVTSTLEDGPEHEHLQNCILRKVDAAKEDTDRLRRQCADLEHDEKELSAKIKKKQQELEQSKKRLESLKSARPAFMDEFESLELELQDQYAIYLERFRNLHYLQKELETFEKEERDKERNNERSMKRMQQKLHEEEMEILRGVEEELDTSGEGGDAEAGGEIELSNSPARGSLTSASSGEFDSGREADEEASFFSKSAFADKSTSSQSRDTQTTSSSRLVDDDGFDGSDASDIIIDTSDDSDDHF